MALYKIADAYFYMEPKYETLSKQALPYLCSAAEEKAVRNSDIRIYDISASDALLKEYQEIRPVFSLNDCEYMLCGYGFTRYLLEFEGMMLHSSAVVYDGKAYLFSANCGTGKSTHTNLWTQVFDGAFIINDDKPAIRFIDGDFYVYGTPFSGKCDLSRNTRAKLAGICMLERGEQNEIKRIDDSIAIPALMNQIFRPKTLKNMDRCLEFIDKLVKNIPFYSMKCTISQDAARMAYEAMSKE